MKVEVSAILNWVIAGCLDWQQAGLDLPDEVKAATEKYRLDMDVLSGFFDDCCILDEKEYVKNKELYEVYRKWAGENGIKEKRILSMKAFNRSIEERGFDFFKDREGKKWLGIRLKT